MKRLMVVILVVARTTVLNFCPCADMSPVVPLNLKSFDAGDNDKKQDTLCFLVTPIKTGELGRRVAFLPMYDLTLNNLGALKGKSTDFITMIKQPPCIIVIPTDGFTVLK